MTFSVADARKEVLALGLVPQGEIVVQEVSHNVSITDNSTFFIKVLGKANKLENFLTEMEAATIIDGAPQLLLPSNTVSIFSQPATVWKYIKGVTPTLETVTEPQLKSLVKQLAAIRKADSNKFTYVRDLKQVATTVKRRLGSEKAQAMPSSLLKELEALVDAFVIPMAYSPSQSRTLAHSDAHLENMLILENGEVKLIDYESLKLAPPELDLAGLYQNLVQTGHRPDLYKIVEEEFSNYLDVDRNLLREITLMRNVSTTTYCVSFGNWDVVQARVNALKESLKTGMPPTSMQAIR